MYLFIKILIIIAIIMFIPIPFSIRLRYVDEPEVYIYSFKLNIKRIQKKIKKRKSKKTKCDKNDDDKDLISRLIHYKEMISSIDRIKYKPNLRLRLKSHYGLDDAAVTGISYGVISVFLANMYELLKVFFSIKQYDISVEPEYNKLTFDCDLKCIIFISLAKIIYMGIFFLKTIKKSKKLDYSLTQSLI